jgi:hypothetical protein
MPAKRGAKVREERMKEKDKRQVKGGNAEAASLCG